MRWLEQEAILACLCFFAKVLLLLVDFTVAEEEVIHSTVEENSHWTFLRQAGWVEF